MDNTYTVNYMITVPDLKGQMTTIVRNQDCTTQQTAQRFADNIRNDFKYTPDAINYIVITAN